MNAILFIVLLIAALTCRAVSQEEKEQRNTVGTAGDHDMAPRIAQLGARLDNLKGLLRKLQDSLSSKDLVAESFLAEDLTVTTLNGVHVDGFFRDTVAKGYKKKVLGVKSWEAGSRLDAEVEVAKTLNSIPRDHLLTRSTRQTLRGPLVFKDTVRVEGDLPVAGRVNGVKLSRDAVRLSGNQMINGLKIFKDQITVSGTTRVSGDCNSVNLTELARNVLRSSLPQIIPGKKTFASVSVMKDVTASRVCGQDTRRLLGSAVTLGSPARIIAPKTFKKTVAFIGGDINVGTLNSLRDLRRPRERVARQVMAPKVVVHGNLMVRKVLNGQDVDSLVADVIFKDDAQVVATGTKTFSKPQILNGKVTVRGLLNGANLQKDFVQRGRLNIVTGLKIFTGPVKFTQDIEVLGTIDGVDISRLARHSTNTVFGGTIRGFKTFAGGISLSGNGKMLRDGVDVLVQEALRDADSVKVLGETNAYKLNGRLLDRWASNRITLSTDQRLDGQCLVYGDLSASGDVTVEETLNGIYMDSLVKDSLRATHAPQVVSGRKVFNKTVWIGGSTFADKGLNGIDPGNVHDKSIKITNERLGSDLNGEDVTVNGHLKVEKRLNGLDFEAFARDCLSWTDEAPVLQGVAEFDDLQVVSGNVAVRNGKKFLTVSTNQTVTGPFRFCNDVTASESNLRANRSAMGTVTFKGPVSTTRLGVSPDGCRQWGLWASDAVTDSEDDQIVSLTAGKTIVENVSFRRDLRVKRLNGMKLDGTQKTFDVHGKRMFQSAVKVDGRVRLEQGAFLRRKSGKAVQSVYGSVTVAGPLVIIGNVTGRVESGPLAIGEIHVRGNVTANSVNGIDVCRYRSCEKGRKARHRRSRRGL